MKSAEEAVDICSEAHQREPQNIHILRDRAEAYILLQEYEKGSSTVTDYYKTFSFGLHKLTFLPLFLFSAVEDYQEAREFDQDNQEIREGLDRAQKLLKQSRKRDYYKILGVSR